MGRHSARRSNTQTGRLQVERDDATRYQASQANGSGAGASETRRTRGRGGVAHAGGARPRAKGAGSGERSSLMHVGRRVDYAVRALTYLAGQDSGRVVGCAEIET